VAAGEALGRRDRRRVTRAVDAAERQTGLQICVYVGPAQGDHPRAHAEELLARSGAQARPAVMVYVAPEVRRVEVVTHPAYVERLTDTAAQRAVDAMVQRFRTGDVAAGLERGLEVIAREAGPGRRDSGRRGAPRRGRAVSG
jgi:uncharacterized membrane protein YgcG